MTGELILLVDDEPHIVQLAQMYLEQEGFRIKAAGDGLAALEAVEQLQPELVVLDLMLPELDGLEVCRRMRQQKNPTPILMLTARDEDVDKIVGLELGADDYLTKPFNPRELVARVKAILRRSQTTPPDKQELLRVDDLQIDPARREVTVRGEQITLRNKEFDLLYELGKNIGIVLSRDQLLDQVWGYEYIGNTRTVDVHIGHLRKKIHGSSLKIETITGIGYKLTRQ